MPAEWWMKCSPPAWTLGGVNQKMSASWLNTPNLTHIIPSTLDMRVMPFWVRSWHGSWNLLALTQSVPPTLVMRDLVLLLCFGHMKNFIKDRNHREFTNGDNGC